MPLTQAQLDALPAAQRDAIDAYEEASDAFTALNKDVNKARAALERATEAGDDTDALQEEFDKLELALLRSERDLQEKYRASIIPEDEGE